MVLYVQIYITRNMKVYTVHIILSITPQAPAPPTKSLIQSSLRQKYTDESWISQKEEWMIKYINGAILKFLFNLVTSCSSYLLLDSVS